MSLKKTAVIVSLSLALLFIVLAGSLIVLTSQIRNAADSILVTAESIRLSEELHIELLTANRELRLFHFTKDSKHWENVAQSKKRITQLLKNSEQYVADDEELELLQTLDREAANFLSVVTKDTESSAQDDYLTRSRILQSAIEVSKALTDLNVAQAHQMQAASSDKDRIANALGIFSFVLALFGCGSFLLIMRYWVLIPIDRLQKSIASFSTSDHETAVPEQGPSEIVLIASAFNNLVSNLIDQRKAQLRFLASVAHDLKNPLGAIKMSTQLLEDEGLASEQLSLVKIIGRQATHLERMVGDFLDASRIEAGNLEIKASPRDLRPMISDAIGLHNSVTAIHSLEMDVPPEPLIVNIDPLRISQVLNNLLNNAIKYSPHGGEIRVGLRAAGEFAVLEVEDQGIGINESDQLRIFEPFQRTEVTKATIPGVGLGLSVSKKIIECHGGSISVESQIKKGTKFIVRLPQIRSLSSPAAEPLEH